MLNYFSHHSNFFLFVIGTSGFLIGMLLNKIVHRLPSYLQTRWQSECREFLNSTPILITHSTKKNLLLQIICTLLSIIVVIHFGLHEKTIAALIFTWCLLALSFIDIEHYLLPDNLVLPLLWLGLLLSLFPLFVSSADAILGGFFNDTHENLWRYIRLRGVPEKI
jgi:leader peptidase (prepilin peptidase)/N-methyltransferase